MPWKESSVMEARMEFVVRLRGGEKMTDLCREFGVSRKTAYKFVNRYERVGLEGLFDQRRVPGSIPHRTPDRVVQRIVGIRKTHPSWGAKKIRDYLVLAEPAFRWPAKSTFGEILKRHGLITPSKRRQRTRLPPTTHTRAEQPNDLWFTDFKGEFRLGDRTLNYPLTTTDAASRFILSCQGMSSTAELGAIAEFEVMFREFGLPRAIHSDNGVPFATKALAGLSRLSVWWLRLGIRIERSRPAHPQDNGQHERMHRTLKAEGVRPVQWCLVSQQEKFDRFVKEFNFERPHDALDGKRPADFYTLSARSFPSKLPEPDYSECDEVRQISTSGHFSFSDRRFFLTAPLARQTIGLREVDDGKWEVRFCTLTLGHVDLRDHRFTPHVDLLVPKARPSKAPQPTPPTTAGSNSPN